MTSVDATILRLRYEDGPHDAEAMFVDPRDEHLYLIVKQLTEPESAVYAVPLREVRPGEVGVLRLVARVPLSIVTAADLGPAGIAVRNYLTHAGVPLVGRPDRRLHAGRDVVPRVARIERGHRADARRRGAVLDQ